VTDTAARPGLGATLWPRIQAFGAIRFFGIVVALVAAIYLWIRADGRFPEATVWQVPLMLELLILSLPWRTVSARTIVRWFLIGVGPIFLLTVLLQWLLVLSPLHGWMTDLSGQLGLAGIGLLGNVHSTVWAPITEEVAKVLPLVLLLIWGRSHLNRLGGPLDFAILAAATGAGLGFAEDLFQVGSFSWTTPESLLLGLGIGVLYLLVIVNPLNRYPLPVFDFDINYQGLVGILNPSVEELELGATWPGHGVLPLLVGLAIGFAVLGRRRYGTRLVYLLPALALVWAIWDHFVANWYSFARCERADAPTLCGLTQLDFIGGLLPLVAIGGWALATLASQRVVARHAATDPVFDLTRRQLTPAAYRSVGLTWPIAFARDVMHYLTARNRSAFGVFHMQHASADERQAQAEPMAAARIQGAVLAARLRNEPLPELPARTAAFVDRLTSRM